jgi:hypothetical protein
MSAPVLSAISPTSFYISPAKPKKKGSDIYTCYFQSSANNDSPWIVQVGEIADPSSHLKLAFDPNENPFDDGKVITSRLGIQLTVSNPETQEFFDAFDEKIIAHLCASPELNKFGIDEARFREQVWNPTVYAKPDKKNGGTFPARMKGKIETSSDQMFPPAKLMHYDQTTNETWDIHHSELKKNNKGIVVMWPYNIWSFNGKMGVSWIYSTFMRFPNQHQMAVGINMGSEPTPTQRNHSPDTAAGQLERHGTRKSRSRSRSPNRPPAKDRSRSPQPVQLKEEEKDDDASTIEIDPVTMQPIYR